jgi:hypothetical protein
MKDRAKGFEKRAATNDAQQLAPGTTVGMAVSAEIPPACPTPVPAIRVRTEMGGSVGLDQGVGHPTALGRLATGR